jgi:hypothetical protein
MQNGSKKRKTPSNTMGIPASYEMEGVTNVSLLRFAKLAFLIIVAATAIGSSALPAVYAAGGSAPASGFDVQVVVDQTSVMPGEAISYHILYHNTAERDLVQATISVRFGTKATVQDSGGGTWDASSGTLEWKLPTLAANGAGVINFSLRAGPNLAVGDTVDLETKAAADIGFSTNLTNVRVTVGTELHQPAFNGYPDGGFHPQGKLTRGETAAIIARMEQLQEQGAGHSYTDVPDTNWAYSYIEKVTKAGWMEGDGGRFRPDASITRAELAVILLRIRGIHPIPLAGFADTLSNWAEQSIGTAKALGYVSGDADGRFNGESAIAREDAAKLLAIALSRGELTDGAEKVVRHWPDVVPGTWSFGWVEELSLIAHESSSLGGMKEALIRYWPEKTQPF